MDVSGLKVYIANTCAMYGAGAVALLASLILFYGFLNIPYDMSLIISIIPVYITIRLVREKIESNRSINELLVMPEKVKRTP
jgi:hypothetical protein